MMPRRLLVSAPYSLLSGASSIPVMAPNCFIEQEVLSS
mgnify:CR=1 FL=1